MCLYTRSRQPKVAKRDFVVLKYLNKTKDGFKSPCQGTPVKLGETMIPHTSTPDIKREGTDGFKNEIFSLTGGAIHAKLSENGDYGNYCAKAIIPKGAKYWIDSFGTEIAASEMIITKIEGSNKLLGTTLYKEILDNAPEINGIRIGDYQLIDDSFVHPTKRMKKSNVRGIVCGFYQNGSPMICALEMFRKMWDSERCSQFGEFLSESEAKKSFNGREITRKYKEKVKTNKKERFGAFEICINYRKDKFTNEDWYFGSLGEVMTMLDNALYLNAAHMISGLGFLITTEYWYGSCSEGDWCHSWCCGLGSSRVGCGWDSKSDYGRVVPFYASTAKQESNSITN